MRKFRELQGNTEREINKIRKTTHKQDTKSNTQIETIRRAWQPTPVSLPGESHGQRSRVGYSPWGCKESDTTDVTEHACTHHYLFICPKFRFRNLILSFHSPDDNTVHFAPQLDNPQRFSTVLCHSTSTVSYYLGPPTRGQLKTS